MPPTPRKPVPLALAGLVAALTVTLAARAPHTPAPQGAAPQGAAAQPAAPAATPQDSATAAADSAAPGDSLAPADSTAADSMATPMAVVAPAPAPAPAPATWPVDPVTGQTLINGIPVVGRVFIMHKTDHLQKMGTVAEVLARETGAPEPPHADADYTPAPTDHARRFRGIMVQATLWDMDTKRTAAERRYFRPSTQAP